jgi:hypothetical protein
MSPPEETMSIGRLDHHVGLHVEVNVEGKTVGGELVLQERWMSGVVVGLSALGDYVSIKLDEGGDLVGVDDASRVRPLSLEKAQPSGVPDDIVELVRKGKTKEAIKRYRALNGATLDEAKIAIARLS